MNSAWYRRAKDLVPLLENSLLKILAGLGCLEARIESLKGKAFTNEVRISLPDCTDVGALARGASTYSIGTTYVCSGPIRGPPSPQRSGR